MCDSLLVTKNQSEASGSNFVESESPVIKDKHGHSAHPTPADSESEGLEPR